MLKTLKNIAVGTATVAGVIGVAAGAVAVGAVVGVGAGVVGAAKLGKAVGEMHRGIKKMIEEGQDYAE